MNTTTINGNLSADPKLRYTPDGQAFANFTLYIYRRKNDDGTRPNPTRIQIQVWNQAEEAAESLHKGDFVLVVGSLMERVWQDENGQNKSSVFVKASSVYKSILTKPTN